MIIYKCSSCGKDHNINDNRIISQSGEIFYHCPETGDKVFIRIRRTSSCCFWKYDEYLDTYDSSCGDSFYFGTGNIKDNRFVYCPRCGRKIFEH